jgi:hypothetical protein
MNFDDLVKGFEDLSLQIKDHRTSTDLMLERSFTDLRHHLDELRQLRDQEYKRNYKNFLVKLKEYTRELEKRERAIDSCFESVCPECYDNLRAKFYK